MEGFCVTGLGGLHLEGLVFGVLRYIVSLIVDQNVFGYSDVPVICISISGLK